jgi:hypothetical protein
VRQAATTLPPTATHPQPLQLLLVPLYVRVGGLAAPRLLVAADSGLKEGWVCVCVGGWWWWGGGGLLSAGGGKRPALNPEKAGSAAQRCI